MELDPRMKILEENHRREKSKLQRAFEAEQKRIQAELEKVISNGNSNIARLEKERKDLERKRDEKLKNYENEMKKMTDEHKNEMNQQRNTEEKLRKQKIDEKKSQMKREHQQYAELIDKQSAELQREREKISTVAVLKSFLTVMRTSHETIDSLRTVKIYCCEGCPESFEANINFELDNIRELREKFQNQFQQFPQFLLNEPRANNDVVDSCRYLIGQVETTMDDDMMRELCGVLPSALENGNRFRIKSFGNDAEFLATELSRAEEKTSNLLIENRNAQYLSLL